MYMHFTREIRKLLQRQPLDGDVMATFWGAMLDGALDDAEMGAVAAALAVAGETRDELAGLHRAARGRLARWCPPIRSGLVSIPAYGVVPGEALCVALTCALLRRFEIPVVVHGVLDSACGASSASLLRELGIIAVRIVRPGRRAPRHARRGLPARAARVTHARAAAGAARPARHRQRGAPGRRRARSDAGLGTRVLFVAGGASERLALLEDDAEGDW